MSGAWTFDEAAQRLFRARTERIVAKRALRVYREERGSCVTLHHGKEPDDPDGACYEWQIPRENWCAICLGANALWETYQSAAREQAAAMRTFMGAGHRLLVEHRPLEGET